MRNYTLAITANKSYVANGEPVEREWSMAITSTSPFSLTRSYSKEAEYIENKDFGFTQSQLKPANRLLSGSIVFKGTATKKAEQLMQEFIAFTSNPEIDFDIFKSTDIRYFERSVLEQYFQRKILKSTNTDTGKTLFCYVSAISLSNIERVGADIFATLNLTATSLWLEEISYSSNSGSISFVVDTEAPTEVSFLFSGDANDTSVTLEWYKDNTTHATSYAPIDKKRLYFKPTFRYGFVGNIRGFDACIGATYSGFYYTFYGAYSGFNFQEGNYTKCIVENGDHVNASIYTGGHLEVFYFKKYWSD